MKADLISPGQQHLSLLPIVRAYELEIIKRYLPSISDMSAKCNVLELGAGTGLQAKKLSELGYQVTALDIADSSYRNLRCFEIREYDGISIPLHSNSQNVVFSSHVLEHVVFLDQLLAETHRVLHNNGVCIHLVPAPICRFWTLFAHYIWVIKRIIKKLYSKKINNVKNQDIPKTPKGVQEWLNTIFPPKHGERGNTVSEIYYYSQWFWKRKFKKNGFEIIDTVENKLFYTMANSLDKELSMEIRKKLSSVLGSAAYVYVLRKRG